MYTYKEPLNWKYKRALPPELLISDDAFSETLLIRLLTGTSNIVVNESNKEYESRISYNYLSYLENKILSSKPVRESLNSLPYNKIIPYLIS